MLYLILFPIFQIVYALDGSTLVSKTAGNNSPCKSCKSLVELFEKVLISEDNCFVYMGHLSIIYN